MSSPLCWFRFVSFSTALLVMLLASLIRSAAAQTEWQPAKGRLMTRWAKEVSPERVHPEYPRPQMVRAEWLNLNGLWDYAIAPKDAPRPAKFDGQILVPFPIESALSGVMKSVGESNRLWYRRLVNPPAQWSGQRVLLHFGGVDWESTVWVNGKELGKHRGGYDSFSFDITGALSTTGEQDEVVVAVWDPTDAGPQPRGKQVRKPGGIWYTPVTGIWRTPWLEAVPAAHIEKIKLTPDIDAGELRVMVRCQGVKAGEFIEVTVVDAGGGEVAVKESRVNVEFSVPVRRARLWTPDDPYLYSLNVALQKRDGDEIQDIDAVRSYFGMRKIALGTDDKGALRLFLNNKALFQLGPLDQGWWPDGLYAAPTDEALRYDIEMTKQLGFNMARKHVKVEPDRWYYWCDKLGLLVWQDMPSGDKSARWRGPSGYDGEEMQRTPESSAIYEGELEMMMDGLHNHPSIVVWVPFNEGWGQFDTVRILNWTMRYDPSRLVDGASGGNHFPAGHMIDHHQYPGPGAPKRVTDRALVLGEYGGLGLPLAGHTWQDEKNWGYRSFKTSEELTEAYVGLVRKLRPMIGSHELAAAIYTQTTDVEVEVNGLMTYDRAVVKMDAKQITAANRSVYGPPPVIKTIAATSEQESVLWRYTTNSPGGNWSAPDFDDSGWDTGLGGFGSKGTPGAVVRTEWKTPEIWMRRTFELPASSALADPHFVVHHDEDAEVYVNGQLAATFPKYIGGYEQFRLNSQARAALRPGKNTLALRCKQTTGGQYIDVGIVDVVEQKAR